VVETKLEVMQEMYFWQQLPQVQQRQLLVMLS